MPTAILIKNPTNNNILRCKFGEKNIILGLLNGSIMRGISIPVRSALEKTPTVDMFIKDVLNCGFKQEHIDLITESAKIYCK